MILIGECIKSSSVYFVIILCQGTSRYCTDLFHNDNYIKQNAQIALFKSNANVAYRQHSLKKLVL